jgi:hypothetical protein
VPISLAELQAQAEAEIRAAFVEYVAPVTRTIEHQPLPQPQPQPPAAPEPEATKQPREYAAPGPLEVDPTVTRLRQRNYRQPRGGSSWTR